MRITAPTPDDPLSNVLFVTNDGRRAALHIGRYKTSKSKGHQKIVLDEFDYFTHHLYIFLTKHRPMLLQPTAAFRTQKGDPSRTTTALLAGTDS